MNDWVEVDAKEINREVTKEIKGVCVKVSFSPYDVPRLFRGYREKDPNFFVVEFKYITEETTRPEKPDLDSPIELEVGVNSKRIYKIKIDVEKLGCEAVRLEIEPLAKNVVGAIRRFSSTLPQKLQGRYKMPESVVFNKRNQIFGPLYPPAVSPIQ